MELLGLGNAHRLWSVKKKKKKKDLGTDLCIAFAKVTSQKGKIC